MPRFAEQVEVAIEALSTNPPQAFEENEFIDASRLVYDGVRDIRKAVLMIRVRSDTRTHGTQKPHQHTFGGYPVHIQLLKYYFTNTYFLCDETMRCPIKDPICTGTRYTLEFFHPELQLTSPADQSQPKVKFIWT